MKILVADDSAVTRHILEGHLTQWGHEVLLATDGAEACQWLAREDGPALAIVDWIMPNGWDRSVSKGT
jgi:CheY-like chemotaxis protein